MKIILMIMFMSTTGFANDIYVNNLYLSRCANCHGNKGQGMSGYAPKLAGQFSSYLNDQIKDIKSGDRNNGRSPIMKPIFSSLSDAEIRSISDWLSRQK